MQKKSAPGKTVRLILIVWLLLAFVVGGTGWLRPAPAPVIAVTVAVLTASALVACRKIDAISQWLGAVDLRTLVSLHLTRFVGIYFLILAHRGELNPAFARPAGFGDCVVAAGALLLLIFWRHLNGHALLLVWNMFGLLDILLVVVLALRVGLAKLEFDVAVAGIATQPVADVSRSFDHRLAHLHFHESGAVEYSPLKIGRVTFTFLPRESFEA